jgi:hypothetical protein
LLAGMGTSNSTRWKPGEGAWAVRPKSLPPQRAIVCFVAAGGSRIDYFAGSQVFARLTQTVGTIDASIAKHRAVTLDVGQVVESKMVEVIKVSKGIQGWQAFGPRPQDIQPAQWLEVEPVVEGILGKCDRMKGELAQQQVVDVAWRRFP